MAFLPQEQQNQMAPQGQTSTQGTGTPPPQTGGSAGAGSTAPKAGAAPSAGTPTQFGSSASKLGDYLTANAPQIQNQANQVTNNLNNQYGQVSNDINNYANQFGQTVSQGYVAPNQEVVNQAVANPTGFASQPGNVSDFQAQYNDTYKGPTSYESTTPYGQIQGEVNQAVQNAGLLNNQAGLQGYFSQNAGPNATKASNTLDALLLQGNPGAQQQIQQAAGQFKGLTDQFGNSVTAANQGVTAAQQAAQQASQYAQNQIKPVVQNFGTSLNDQLAAINANETAYNQNVTQNQQNATAAQQALNNLYPTALNKAISGTGNLGNPTLDAAEKARITGLLNPGYQNALTALQPYLSGQPITQPGTLANTATSQQYAEDQALAQLLGQNYNPLLNQANLSQAGSYKVPEGNGKTPDLAGEQQYLNDLADLYGNPNANYYGTSNNPAALTPAQQAQKVMQFATPGSGLSLTPDDMAALQRLSGGEQGYGS
jgi:hypothetical protein